MIESQLYFWILKSYQHGTRIGGEKDSRPKHITAWTWNVAEEFCMRLCLSACICICMRPRVSSCVRGRLHVRVCAQKIKRLDASRRKRISASRCIFCSRTFRTHYMSTSHPPHVISKCSQAFPFLPLFRFRVLY